MDRSMGKEWKFISKNQNKNNKKMIGERRKAEVLVKAREKKQELLKKIMAGPNFRNKTDVGEKEIEIIKKRNNSKEKETDRGINKSKNKDKDKEKRLNKDKRIEKDKNKKKDKGKDKDRKRS
jgi:hypothetical protein